MLAFDSGVDMSYLPDVANLAELHTLLVTGIPDHSRVRVLTLLQEFWYHKESKDPADGITVIVPIFLRAKRPLGIVHEGPRGRWIRNPLPVPEWTAKRTWFQDNVNGNDENPGDETSPVKTIAEIARRLRRVDSGLYTIQLLRQVDSTDSVCFAAEMGDIKSPVLASTQTVGSILIRGMRTEVKPVPMVPIDIGAVTNTDPSTNTQAEVKAKDPDFNWTPYVGLFLEATWTIGPKPIVVQAVILKAPSLGVARVSGWVNPLSGNPIPIAPAPATATPRADAAYKIVSLTDFAAQIGYSSLPPRVLLAFQDVTVLSPPVPPPMLPSTVPGLLSSACTTSFVSCRFRVPIAAPPATYQSDCSIRACSVDLPDLPRPEPAGPYNFCSTAGGTGPRFSGCGLINARIQVSSHGRVIISDTVLQGGSIRGVDAATGRIFGGLLVVLGKVGIFDAPLDPPTDTTPGSKSAVTLRSGMAMHIRRNASLYGRGNAVYGVEVLEGATLAIHTDVLPLPPGATPSFPPTITGAIGDLHFEGADTAIPELLAGGRVPDAEPLTKWVEWAGPKFRRNVLSFKTGSRIISTG